MRAGGVLSATTAAPILIGCAVRQASGGWGFSVSPCQEHIGDGEGNVAEVVYPKIVTAEADALQRFGWRHLTNQNRHERVKTNRRIESAHKICMWSRHFCDRYA